MTRWLQQRFPMLGLAGLAVLGIGVAALIPIPPFWWAGACLLLWGAFCVWKREVCFSAGVFCAFAALYAMQFARNPSEQLAQQLATPRVAQVTGKIVSAPDIARSGRTQRGLLEIHTLAFGESPPVRTSLRVRLISPVMDWQYGDAIQATVSLSAIPPTRNPGEFDQQRWLNLQGVWLEARCRAPADISLQARNQGNPIVASAIRMREKVSRNLERGLEFAPEISALIQAMTLGETRGLSPIHMEEFRITGTYHLFSVSGLHVGMLAFIFWFAARTLGVSRFWSACLVIPLLFYYAMITGFKPSSTRAAFMASVVLIGILAGRRSIALNSLGAAAFAILLWDTGEFFSPGFQFSFVVTGALLLLATPLSRQVQPWLSADPFIPRQLISRQERFFRGSAKKIAALGCVSLAAWLGSLPLTIPYFHMVPTYSIPANMVVVPLSFLVLTYAVTANAAALVSTTLAEIFNLANWAILKLVCAIVAVIAGLPGSVIPVGWNGWPAPTAEVQVFDFAHGGAVALRVDNKWWLIDGGSRFQAEYCLIPFLRSRGVHHLEGAIGTHGDSSHLSGLEAVAEQLDIRNFYFPATSDRSPVRKRLETRTDGSQHLWSRGDTLFLHENAALEILFPPEDWRASLADDKAFVLMLRLGERRILLTSDAGVLTESWLRRLSPEQLTADIWIKGQHTSGQSGDLGLLREISPQLLIATHGDHPDTERISSAWAEQVSQTDTQLLRLDQTGGVRILFHPENICVERWLQPEPLVISPNPDYDK